MKAILVQQKISKALDELYPYTINDKKKVRMSEIAYSSLILHFLDSILRIVEDCKTTSIVSAKLDKLYLVKSSLTKSIYLRGFFYLR